MHRAPKLLLTSTCLFLPLFAVAAGKFALSPEEQKIVAHVDAPVSGFAADLAALVQIDRATENLAGVKQMGDHFVREFAALGFDWATG